MEKGWEWLGTGEGEAGRRKRVRGGRIGKARGFGKRFRTGISPRQAGGPGRIGLAGVERNAEWQKRVGQGRPLAQVDPDAASGLADARAEFEDARAERFDLRGPQRRRQAEAEPGRRWAASKQPVWRSKTSKG